MIPLKRLLILISIALGSCNQTGIGVSAGLKNIVTAPVSLVRSGLKSVTGDTYSNYARQTAELRREEPDSCGDREPPEKGMFAKIRDAMIGVRDEVCTCRPWGTCPPKGCDCKALCPDSFDIFSIHKARTQGSAEDELAFGNGPRVYKNHPATHGYCWGHASITAKFNRLAFFEPSKRVRASANSSAWRSYYSDLIDRIAANEATDVPGFSSLQEFSSHPTIQELLADKVANEWGDKAMTMSGLSAGLSSGRMAPEEIEPLLRDLKRRVAHYQSPQLLFTRLDEKFRTHAVLVSRVEERGGVARICLRDSNDAPAKRGECSNYFDVRRTGAITTSTGKPIGGVHIAGNEDADTIEQLHSLRKRCEKIKGCG